MHTAEDYFLEHRKVVARSLEHLRNEIDRSAAALIDALAKGKKVLAFGNGGSATQAGHFVGELVGRFDRERRPLPALALSSEPGSVTCIGNDYGYGALFERQVQALAAPGDIAVGLTTSGRSENVLRGLTAARERGATTFALTGAAGLQGTEVDFLLAAPDDRTAFIQEVHLMLIHYWCRRIDDAFAGREALRG